MADQLGYSDLHYRQANSATHWRITNHGLNSHRIFNNEQSPYRIVSYKRHRTLPYERIEGKKNIFASQPYGYLYGKVHKSK